MRAVMALGSTSGVPAMYLAGSRRRRPAPQPADAGTQYYEVHARYIVKAEVSAVGQYWRRALIRIVRYSLVWGCDDGQPDLPGGGHVVLLGSGQLDYLVSQWPLMEART